jgi:SPOR domain
MAVIIGPPTRSRRFVKLYLSMWALLASGALAYLALLTFPPNGDEPAAQVGVAPEKEEASTQVSAAPPQEAATQAGVAPPKEASAQAGVAPAKDASTQVSVAPPKEEASTLVTVRPVKTTDVKGPGDTKGSAEVKGKFEPPEGARGGEASSPQAAAGERASDKSGPTRTAALPEQASSTGGTKVPGITLLPAPPAGTDAPFKPLDKSGSDKSVGDKSVGDKPGVDKAGLDKSAADKPGVEKAGVDNSAADKAAADKPAVDKSSTDKPVEESTATAMAAPPTAPIETGSIPKAEIVFGEPVVKRTAGGPREMAVQLAAAPSLEAVRQSWALLSEQYGMLVALQPRVVAPREQGGVYRLLAGPLPSKADAERICSQLGIRGKACFATQYIGAPL